MHSNTVMLDNGLKPYCSQTIFSQLSLSPTWKARHDNSPKQGLVREETVLTWEEPRFGVSGQQESDSHCRVGRHLSLLLTPSLDLSLPSLMSSTWCQDRYPLNSAN